MNTLKTFLFLLILFNPFNPCFAQHAEQLHVGVLLPFSGSEARTQKMVEFYRGVLMGVDSVTREHRVHVDVTALDCGTTQGEMQRLLAANPSLGKCQLIIGPQAQEQLHTLSQFCAGNAIRLVVPFSEIGQHDGAENVFVVSSAENERATMASMLFNDLFRRDHVVRFTGVDGVKGSLAGTLAERCQQAGINVNTVHIDADDDEMIAQMDTLKRNVIIVGGGDLSTVNCVMARIDALTGAHPGCKVALIGGYEWQNFIQQHLHNYYKYDTYIPVTQFRNVLSAPNVAFENQYMRLFSTQMINSSPRFAPMGFDIAYFFVGMMAQYGTEGTAIEENLTRAYARHRPLQHSLFFQWSGDGCWVNRSCRFVHYSPQGQIELLSK